MTDSYPEAPPVMTTEHVPETATEDVPETATPASRPGFGVKLELTQFMCPPTARRSPRHQTAPDQATAVPAAPPTMASPSRRRQPKREQPDRAATPASARVKRPRLRRRPRSGYAPPSTYAHLPVLPDVLGPGLLVLFVGLNPGLRTAGTGHHYAHPTNRFWTLLARTGLTPVRCRPEEDGTLPARFGLGSTNIVARPSRNGAELSRAEMDAGVDTLETKVRAWRPEVACVVGKSIWESVWRVRKGKNMAKQEFRYGWQDETENMGVIKEGDDGFEGARVFVAPSTSGLAASIRPEERERIWKELGDWCVQRRLERTDALQEGTTEGITLKDAQVKTEATPEVFTESREEDM